MSATDLSMKLACDEIRSTSTTTNVTRSPELFGMCMEYSTDSNDWRLSMESKERSTFLPRRPSDRASFFVIRDSVLPLSQSTFADTPDDDVAWTASHNGCTGSIAGWFSRDAPF